MPENPSGWNGHGTPDAYREYISEALAMARIQAEIGEAYAALRDDAGLDYSLRRLAAYVKSAREIYGDLKAMKAQRSTEHRKQAAE